MNKKAEKEKQRTGKKSRVRQGQCAGSVRSWERAGQTRRRGKTPLRWLAGVGVGRRLPRLVQERPVHLARRGAQLQEALDEREEEARKTCADLISGLECLCRAASESAAPSPEKRGFFSSRKKGPGATRLGRSPARSGFARISHPAGPVTARPVYRTMRVVKNNGREGLVPPFPDARLWKGRREGRGPRLHARIGGE